MARKILLADDSVTAQNMGRKILADAGYEVITVNNGSAALKKIAELKPDLIVLDVYMPGYSGLEVCQRLKDVGETARIPVLLTVGKLEPFKTEEAKRVRADGYIVKPFEASELLGALSKLEDKIVPRAEASKPGRFARATAAIEEARQDKSATAEDNSGWKNRISFPSKTKETAAEGDADDPAIYNPVNKDLRTTVDHRPDHSRDLADEKVDLGALAPEGLPKDVTPEEIAALAAAAAQVQGKILESKPGELREEAAPTAPIQSKVESIQEKADDQPVESSPEGAASVTFAEQTGEKSEPVGAISEEHSTVASGKVIEMPSAILESRAHSDVEPSADEPVTIAAAAGAGFGGAASRWTAVSVALAPEDNGLSLEQEMQQAYAAYAVADTGPSVTATTDTSSLQDSQPETEASVPEVDNPIPAIAASETIQTLSAVADDTTQVGSPAAKEVETVTSSYATESASHPASASSWSSEGSGEPAEVPAQAAFVAAESAAGASSDFSQEVTNQEVQSAQDQPVEESRHVAAEEQTGELPVPVDAHESSASAATNERKDPDMAATTAAAWASWRRSRESGMPLPSATEPASEAAMAVAAGAENSPEDVASEIESDPAIASIVDSVLAGLRPKIVEEISRKLGKKK